MDSGYNGLFERHRSPQVAAPPAAAASRRASSAIRPADEGSRQGREQGGCGSRRSLLQLAPLLLPLADPGGPWPGIQISRSFDPPHGRINPSRSSLASDAAALRRKQPSCPDRARGPQSPSTTATPPGTSFSTRSCKPHAAAPPGRPAALISERGVDGCATSVGLVSCLARAVLTSGTSLARFVHSSMQPRLGPPKADRCESPTDDIFPCPPPFEWQTGTPPKSSRRRHRFHQERAIRVWINLIFAVCSWSSVGQAAACPPRARVGRALSRAQLQAVARVRLHVSSLVRLPWDGSGGLKLNALHAELLREGRYEGGFSNEELQGPHVALSADRIKFGVGLEQFDPLPYLDPFTASTYIEPEILRGRAPPKQAPFPLQRNVSEVIKLAKRWDAVNRLRLYLASEVPKKRRSALTAVQKDELFDRLILDRRGPNAEEAHLARASQDLAPGWRLTDVELSPDQSLLLYSTDLCEMFFAFRISPERGATNCIAAEVELHHLSDTKAAKLFRRRFPRGPPQERVLMALFTEPMGDLSAVDYAQEAHGAVLQSGGSWLPEHRILGQRPLPRGDWLEMLTVDDHCGIALVPRSNPDGASPGRRLAEQSFSASAAVYAKIPGLDVHPTKGLAGVSKGVLLGAGIDGEAESAASPASRPLQVDPAASSPAPSARPDPAPTHWRLDVRGLLPEARA